MPRHPIRLPRILRRPNALAIMPATAAIHAEAPLATADEPMLLLIRIGWIAALILFSAAGACWGAIRLRRLQREQQLAAEKFEEQILRTMNPPLQTPPTPPSPTPSRPVADPVTSVVRRLREAGLVDSEEKLILRTDMPPVVFLRLKQGRTTIVFPPEIDAPHALQFNRAADLMVLTHEESEPFILRPLGAFLADEIFPA